MTKPLIYGCIKKAAKIHRLSQFNAILNGPSIIGHLFIVDIKFHNKNNAFY